MDNIHDSKSEPNFSIVLGGPLYQLLMRLHLTTPTLQLLKRRIAFITLFAWLPLFLLSLYSGQVIGGKGIPFLYDLEVQSRFLIALPLLIAAELLVHKRLRIIVGQFTDNNIITQEVFPNFKKIIDSAMSLRNSTTAEILLIIFVLFTGQYVWNSISILEKLSSGSWYAVQNGSQESLSPAGYWYIYISRPLFQFIGYRWYYRLMIWARFLWQTSKLKLNLIPTHPDRACGLGFLSLVSIPFSPLIIAHGVLVAGLIANSIIFAGTILTSHVLIIAYVVVFLLLLVLGPLFVFSPQILRAQREGILDYGILASRYVEEFEHKWIKGGADRNATFIGTSDIQSLADLANSFNLINTIRAFPFDRKAILQVIFFALLPIIPLVLTMIPLNVLIEKFFQVIF